MIGFARRFAPVQPAEPALPAPASADEIAGRILRAASIHVMGAAYRTPDLVHEMLALAPLIDTTVEDALLELDTAARVQNALSLLRAVQHDWAVAQCALDMPVSAPSSNASPRDWSRDPRGALASGEDLLIARLRLVALRFDTAAAAPAWPRVRLLLHAFGYDETVIAFLRGGEATPIDTDAEAERLRAARLANGTPIFRTELIQLFEFLTGVLGLVEPQETAALCFAEDPSMAPHLATVLDGIGD